MEEKNGGKMERETNHKDEESEDDLVEISTNIRKKRDGGISFTPPRERSSSPHGHVFDIR